MKIGAMRGANRMASRERKRAEGSGRLRSRLAKCFKQQGIEVEGRE